MTLDPSLLKIIFQSVQKKGYPYYDNNGKIVKKRYMTMNLLEEELANLKVTIAAVNKYLEKKKNMSYEDWRNAHLYLDSLICRRDSLLNEKFRRRSIEC